MVITEGYECGHLPKGEYFFFSHNIKSYMSYLILYRPFGRASLPHNLKTYFRSKNFYISNPLPDILYDFKLIKSRRQTEGAYVYDLTLVDDSKLMKYKLQNIIFEKLNIDD